MTPGPGTAVLAQNGRKHREGRPSLNREGRPSLNRTAPPGVPSCRAFSVSRNEIVCSSSRLLEC